MKGEFQILEVIASADAVTTILRPTQLTTEDYGRILAGLAGDIAAMMASNGIDGDLAFAQICAYFEQCAKPPSARTTNATRPH